MRRRLYYRSGMKAAVIGLYRGRRTVSWKLIINSADFIYILKKWSDCRNGLIAVKRACSFSLFIAKERAKGFLQLKTRFFSKN